VDIESAVERPPPLLAIETTHISIYKDQFRERGSYSPPSRVKVNRNGDKAASYGVWSAPRRKVRQ